MDESKEKELERVNVVDSTVTVQSVATATVTVIKKVLTSGDVDKSQERVGVSEKPLVEKDGGACEVGDVMVEVLGSEVIVDGVGGISGEASSDELGCRDIDFGAVSDDGGKRVDEFVDCQHGGLVKGEDVLGSCVEGNLASQLRDQSVGGNDSSLVNIASQDDTYDVDKNNTRQVAADRDIERQSGDVGGKKDAELLDNVFELYQDSNNIIVEGKGTDILQTLHKITSSDRRMDTDEESLETLKRTSDRDIQYEGDEHVVLEAGAHIHSTVLEVKLVNGATNLVGAPVTSDERGSLDTNVCSGTDQQKPDGLESLCGDADNGNSVSSDFHTEIDRIDHVNGANQIIPVPTAIMLINDKAIKEGLVGYEKSDSTSLIARPGHDNGTIDEKKIDRTDMESDAACENVIYSENKLLVVDLKGKYIEKNFMPTSLSKVPVEEAQFLKVNSDISDPISVSRGMICETPNDDLKPYSENQEPEPDDNTKEAQPIAFATVVEQCMGADGKVLVEILSTCSPVLDAIDDSDVKDVIQESECTLNASHTKCLDSHTTDGVAEIGLNSENVQEAQEVMHSKQVSVDYGLPNEGDNTEVLQPVRLVVDADENVIPKVPDKQAFLFTASTNEEEKTIKLSDHVISSIENVIGESVLKVVHEVQEVSFYNQSVAVDNSNMRGMEGVQEKAVNAEGAVYMNNDAPDEEETPKQHNLLLSDSEGTRVEKFRVDENVTVSPFVVEIDGSGDAGSGYLNMNSGPIHDKVGRPESPHSSYNSHAKGLGLEAEDHEAKIDSDMEDASEQESDNAEQVEEQEFDEEYVSSLAKRQNKERIFSAYTKSDGLLKDHRVSYQLPPEIHGELSEADLVWGKVKSHPWWPGQIFHPSDASEKAMKHFRKDCYLVAYFGDRTFAWNEASVLKPFRNHFSVAERQNRTEAFQNAVSCALEEVSRRMELGLACSCVSEEAYDMIRYQMVENTGIRKESSKRDGADRCRGLEYFQPDKLVEYVRSLAIFPTNSVDRLELVIAKAHLVAFLRLKGIDCLADYQYYEGISCEFEHEDSATRFDFKATLKGPKRKHNLKDIVYQRREKSLSELMGETMYYLDSEFDSHEDDDNMLASPSMKRKVSGSKDFTSQPTTKTICVAKLSNTPSFNPQQSFKVGECIQRVASQLTGSSSVFKDGSDIGDSEHLGDATDEVVEASDDSVAEMSPSPSHESSLDDMLSQLHLSAQDPMKGYSFLVDIISFFSEFRNLAVSNQRQKMRRGPGRKRKSSTPVAATPETFEFDDRNDSYWRDMVVQNSAEAKPSRRGRKRKEEQGLSVDSEKPSQSKPRKSSRKQYFHGSVGSTVEIPSEDKERRNQLPTELLISFTGMGSTPSEINLNKMFRRFGPLKESETEIDVQSSRARVVFKRRSDAEVAYSSASMFNIFGSTLVSYQLNYIPSVSFKTCRLELMNNQEKAT